MSEPLAPEEWPFYCLGQARVTGDGLRCREAPRLNGRILTTFAVDQVLDVWCRVAGWWLVQVRETGLTGWSSGQFLAMTADG